MIQCEHEIYLKKLHLMNRQLKKYEDFQNIKKQWIIIDELSLYTIPMFKPSFVILKLTQIQLVIHYEKTCFKCLV